MKIPKELTPIAYELSKKVYDDHMTFKDGQELLVGNNRMNPNSAADYIHNFACLMEGKKFTRTNNAFSVDYFLEHIYKDYGSGHLANALKALKFHFEYFEVASKSKAHKMRLIHEKYSAYILPLAKVQEKDEQEQEEFIREFKKEKKTKKEIADELKKLKITDSEEIIIHSKTYKRDNKTIAQIKYLRDFKCQICSLTIKKKDGSFYIEAAHIDPVHKKGRETPDNILILCPNHHKEFDFGNLNITGRHSELIEFMLNEIPYSISLKID